MGQRQRYKKIELDVSLPQNVFQKIDSIINGLSNVKFHPNYDNEKNEIFKACDNPSKKIEKHKYEFDLRLYDNSKKHYYFLEMKGPDPNTTEVPGAKRRFYLHWRGDIISTKLKKLTQSLEFITTTNILGLIKILKY